MLYKRFEYFLVCFGILGVYCQNPEVEIPQGRLRGAIRTNVDDGNYYAFKGIPYAKPPIEELRFKPPRPADGWEGTLDATQEIPECVQAGNIYGQEDCLYLNLYTPGLPEEDVTNLPVMVWIHGGGFTSLSASESFMFGGQFLLTKDIVLVAINYRLGIFGFLSLDDPSLDVTGNAGLKDQTLALEWVRDNIEYFGGDRNNVLIFGESAGGMSIQYHLLSPLSSGLFNKAISQSGDATSPILVPISRNNGQAIAEVLGIQIDNWENMLASLREATVNDLALAEVSLSTVGSRGIVGPVVEITSNGTTFIDRNPIDIIKAGDYNQVPFITGVTDAEGLMAQLDSIRSTGENLLIEDFTEFVPVEFNIEVGSILEELLAIIIRDFYYGDTVPSRDDITQAVALYGDYVMVFPAYRSASEYLKTAQNPIYFYYFTAITGLSYFRTLHETLAAFPGAAHSDDVGHLFYMGSLPPITPGSVEERVMRSMVDLWTNFAIYGNPTPEGSSDFVWEPLREDRFSYLEIATEETFPILNSVFVPNRIDFWWALFEQYTGRTDI